MQIAFDVDREVYSEYREIMRQKRRQYGKTIKMDLRKIVEAHMKRVIAASKRT
jgi:hypothetical protein